MDEIVYPAARFQWHQEIPSVLQTQASAGGKSGSTNKQPSTQVGGELKIHVERLTNLIPPDARAQQYVVTAGYHGEPLEVMQGRRCRPVVASGPPPSTCEVKHKFGIPYNPKQGIVKVQVLAILQNGAECPLGEASVPLADLRVESLADWAICRDYEEYGKVFLYFEFPADEDDYVGTTSAVAAPAAPMPQPGPASMERVQPQPFIAKSTVTSAVHSYKVGDRLEVYSNTAGRWLPGTVVKVQGAEVTIDCGDKLRAVDCSASNVAGYLRRACLVGDTVEVYSRSTGEWVVAKVTDIKGRHATVQYDGRGRVIDLNDPQLMEYFRFPGTSAIGRC
mmetsp:Transcript_62638/g.149405  ORF Transcript_62638/g.149405 Transcript_62638/m.149405 type:complete len:335 (-) Transcript_62638:17-1021(-)